MSVLRKALQREKDLRGRDIWFRKVFPMSKEEDFERLWNSPNYNKACKFRNWVMQKTMVRGVEPTKENCKKYYCGQL